MSFEPIAIIGKAGLFPGALSPEQLWQNSLEGINNITHTPTDNWRVTNLDPSEYVNKKQKEKVLEQGSYLFKGGYVDGFASVFKPELYKTPNIQRLDKSFQWLLHTSREAIIDAGFSIANLSETKAGIIIGLLGYPTDAFTLYGETNWLLAQEAGVLTEQERNKIKSIQPDSINRFMTGLPAHLVAKEFGLTGTAFTLDAACASTLYAVKLACDQLQSGKADMMLTGGMTCCDDLFIHMGFDALQALSPTGNCEPFQQTANGLVPAEGVGIFVLKRLSDAQKNNDAIAGVIRGVGLSNDGASGGFLQPSLSGQVSALKRAYQHAGILPQDVAMIECHATGTTAGDAVEIQTLQQIFGDHSLFLAALKAQLGHALPASAAAAMLRALSAISHGIIPGNLINNNLLEELESSAFKFQRDACSWPNKIKKIVGINAFGLGGTNAHLLLSDVDSVKKNSKTISHKIKSPKQEAVAIVGMGIIAAGSANTDDFKQAFFNGKSQLTRDGQGLQLGKAPAIKLNLQNLKILPNDIQQILPQQLYLMAAVQWAIAEVKSVSTEKNAIFAGMQCDSEIARHGLRWRLDTYCKKIEKRSIKQAKDSIISLLEPTTITGNMPNIVANRVNQCLDLKGASFSVSSEELSGIRALNIAQQQLHNNEIDTAIVGAVDLCAETVFQSAAKEQLPADQKTPGDAAVVLILKRYQDAVDANETIYALLNQEKVNVTEADLQLSLKDSILTPLFGHTHAASGLLHVAAAALAIKEKALPADENGKNKVWDKNIRRAKVVIQALGKQQDSIYLYSDQSENSK